MYNLNNYVGVVLLTTMLAKVVSHFKTKFFAQKKLLPFKTILTNDGVQTLFGGKLLLKH